MILKNVLILYKRSAYKIYFLDKKSSFRIRNRAVIRKELERFKNAHDEHYHTLRTVEEVLGRHGIRYRKSYRGQIIHYDQYDLVITIGGDGTFLEAARGIKKGVVLGVNSSPSYSVGQFCGATAADFEHILRRVVRKDFKISVLHRLRVTVDGRRKPIDCLNDVLVCHGNPAAMSRYALKVGKIKEEQRSSGVWIATPAGSSGAIQSAGGRKIPRHARKMQYLPRELYWGRGWRYRLKGGVLSARRGVTVISLMRQGMVYIDGTHLEFPFPFGAAMKVTLSPYPIKTVNVANRF